MLTRLKELAGQSIIYGVGNLLPRVIGFILIPLYTHVLTPSDYAILSVVMTIISVLGVLYELGLRGAITRLHFEFSGEKKEEQAYYGTAWIFLMGFSLLATLLLNWQGERWWGVIFKEVPFQPYGQLGLWLNFVSMAAIIPLILWRVREKAPIYVIFTTLRFVINTFAIIVFVVNLRQGVAGVLRGQLLAETLLAIPFTIVTLRNARFAFHWEKLKRSLAIGLPLLPHRLSIWALSFSDRILLERFVSLDQLGLYTLGAKFALVLEIALDSVNFAWAPLFYRVATEEKDAPLILSRLVTYFMLFSLTLFLGLSLGAKEVIAIMAAPAYHEAYRMVPLMSFAYILNGIYMVNSTVLFFAKQTKKLPLFTMSSAGLNIFINLFALSRFGIVAAAWAMVAGYALKAILVYRESQRLYPIPFEYRRLGMLFMTALMLFGVGQFVVTGRIFLDLLIKFLMIGAFPVLLFLLRFFTPRELASACRIIDRFMQILNLNVKWITKQE